MSKNKVFDCSFPANVEVAKFEEADADTNTAGMTPREKVDCKDSSKVFDCPLPSNLGVAAFGDEPSGRWGEDDSDCSFFDDITTNISPSEHDDNKESYQDAPTYRFACGCRSICQHDLFEHFSSDRTCKKALKYQKEAEQGFCVGCYNVFRGSRGLSQHLAGNTACPEYQQPKLVGKIHIKSHRCPGCFGRFVGNRKLFVHLSRNRLCKKALKFQEEAEQGFCVGCCKQFRGGRGLGQHVSRNSKCRECKSRLTGNNSIKTQPCQQPPRVETSGTGGIIGWRPCTGCQGKYIGSLGLKVHLAVSMSQKEAEQGFCVGCDKQFCGSRGLGQHLAHSSKCPEALQYQDSVTEEGKQESLKGSDELQTFDLQLVRGRLYARAQRHTRDILKGFCNSCYQYFDGAQGLHKHLASNHPNRLNHEQQHPAVDTSLLEHTEHGFCHVCDTQFDGSEGLKKHLAKSTDCYYLTSDWAVGHVAKAVWNDDFAEAKEYLKKKPAKVESKNRWCNWVHKASMMDVKWIKFLTSAFGLDIWASETVRMQQRYILPRFMAWLTT